MMDEIALVDRHVPAAIAMTRSLSADAVVRVHDTPALIVFHVDVLAYPGMPIATGLNAFAVELPASVRVARMKLLALLAI